MDQDGPGPMRSPDYPRTSERSSRVWQPSANRCNSAYPSTTAVPLALTMSIPPPDPTWIVS
jgi:hypothetical protein